MRVVRLLVSLVVGYALGNIVGDIALAALGGGHAPLVLRASATIGGGVLGSAAAWLRWRNLNNVVVPDTHGSASFASQKAIRAAFGSGSGLVIGRERNGDRPGGKLLHYDGPAHLLTIAPTRSGKGVGAVIPNLLLANRSVLCIDPKGENARVTASARERFGSVHVLDPFGIAGRPSAAFNPLAALDPPNIDLAEDAATLAEALVFDPPGQVGEAHWNEEAKALIAGVIMHVVGVEPATSRTLANVRERLTLSPARFEAQMHAMAKSEAAGGLVARAANRHIGKSEREAAGVLSSAQRHTHFLDSPRMVAVLERSDFSFAELKERVATVFLVLPPDRLDTYARWLRLMVVQAMTALARSERRPSAPVLLLLDEFAALGRLEAVERAFGLMAGYGLQLWAILQDMHQLKGTYGQRAGTFLSNAGVIQIFNVADIETATWLSRSIGQTTIGTHTTTTTASSSPGHFGTSRGSSATIQLSHRALLTPDEVMRLDPSLCILLKPGAAPSLVRKVRYFEDREFPHEV